MYRRILGTGLHFSSLYFRPSQVRFSNGSASASEDSLDPKFVDRANTVH